MDGVDLTVAAGRIVAVVGESGCGKSTTGRLLLALERPSEGTVTMEGRDLNALSAAELRAPGGTSSRCSRTPTTR